MAYIFNKAEILPNGTIQPYLKYDGYYISDKGDVYSDKSGKLLKLKTCYSTKYPSVNLSNGKKRHTTNIHRMVAETFIENNNKEAIQVNHIDGNKLNNNVDNLEWVTAQENIVHAYENELNYGKPKLLNEDDIIEVIALYKQGLSMRNIAQIYNTNHNLISRYLKQNIKD